MHIKSAFNLNCFFLLLLINSFPIYGQKQDYVWLQGYGDPLNQDTNLTVRFGICALNFNHSPVQMTFGYYGISFDKTNTSYSDSNGNLLFYSNGINITNNLTEKIANSDSMNAGYLQYIWDPSIQSGGYRTTQGILALQSPANSSQFYLFYTYVDSIGGTNQLYVKRLYYALLDMSENNGHGKVLIKDQTILENGIGWEMAAIRHGNGIYWWIIVQKRGSNCYYKVLLTERGPKLMSNMACWGSTISQYDVGSIAASPDGTKLASLSMSGGLNIFEFDRCTGEFPSATTVNFPILRDSFWLGQGLAISPNNRFLYAGATKFVFQYDLLAPDIAGSLDTVAIYDGSMNPFGSIFHTMQIGPDGKIYESCGNAEYVYHVIDRPDEKGDSCLFRQHGIHLQSYSCGVPNFPNYRLGALVGSACDTLSGLNEPARSEKEKILKVFPNPTADFVVVDYGFTDWNKGEISLEIENELAQIVYKQNLPIYSGFQKIDASSFPNGFYIVNIKRKNTLVSSSKFVKQ